MLEEQSSSTKAIQKTENSPTATTSLEKIQALKRKAQELLNDARQATISTTDQGQSKRKRRSEVYVSGFKKRVSTYQDLNWKSIPEISPRDFAEHGWVMKGPELVECVSCSKTICTLLPDIKEVLIATYIACVKHIREKLVDAHEKVCIFRSPSADYFSQFRESLDYLKSFYLQNFDGLKRINFGDYVYSDPSMDALIKGIFGEIAADEFLPAYFAITHWIPSIEDEKRVECEFCARVCVPSVLPAEATPSSQHYSWCPLLDLATDGTTPIWKELAGYFKKLEKRKSLSDAFRARTQLYHALSESVQEN